MPRLPHPLLATIAALAAGASIAACGSSGGSTASNTAAATTSTAAATSATAGSTATTSQTSTASHYPVTIENCGSKLTFTKAPTRAVSNDINATEEMLSLGLMHSMVGTFGVTGDGPVGQPVPTQYEAAFKSVKDVSSDYFTLEPLVGLRPDFVFAGWDYGLQTGTRLTPKGLAKFGIKTLALTESCARIQRSKRSVSIDNTYQDLSNLGAIFNVQAKANAVIGQMKAQVNAVQKKVAHLKPVSVFLYDSGSSAPFTAPGLATPNALIQLAGGSNIFGSLKQSWTEVSWEQVVTRQPQCIIINDYSTPTAAQKLKFLKTSPHTRDLPAVRNGCIISLAYDELTPSPRNAEAVQKIAELLHPTAFGKPARS